MTQENKELLVKDLSTRFPYDVIVEYGVKYKDRDLGEKKGKLTGRMLDSYFYNTMVGLSEVYSIKPYLRPMSSMTEEEDKEYTNIDNRSYSCPKDYAHIPASDRIDWLNAHNFDYRRLIERGLAIAVTEDNNPYKELNKIKY